MTRKNSRHRSKRRKSRRRKKKSPNNWRWDFVKNVVTRKRGILWSSRDDPTYGSDMSLAKQMLNSPVRDLTRYPKVMRWLKTNKVYISMTCSPKRLSKVQAVLASIDSKYLNTLYLVLPRKFGRSGELYNSTLIKRIEKNFPIVNVLRIPKDYGPITKLLPVARLLKNQPNSIIITIDDDICYPLGMVNEVIYQKVMKYPRDVLETSGGFYIRSSIREFSKYWPVKRANWPKMDIIEGFSGVAYNPWMLDTELMEKLSEMKACFLSDDLVISYILAKNKVTMRNILNKYWYMPYAYLYGELEDALHTSGDDKTIGSNEHNIKKYRNCLIHIVK